MKLDPRRPQGTRLKAIAHFSRWLTAKGWGIEDIDEELIEYFARFHLPHCKCPAPRIRDEHYVRSGLRHLRKVLKQEGLASITAVTPVDEELEHFKHFLLNVNGLALNTCKSRLAVVAPTKSPSEFSLSPSSTRWSKLFGSLPIILRIPSRFCNVVTLLRFRNRAS